MSLLTRRERREPGYVEYVTARQGHLRRVAFAVCGDWHRAEDLLQTALLKLYVAWPRVEQQGNPDAYVRRIIMRTNIDEHRRRRGRPEILTDALPETASPADPDVVTRSALVLALQELPQMQRKTVLLRHWIGLSVEETAAELGISPGTVKSHTSRGLAALRERQVDATSG